MADNASLNKISNDYIIYKKYIKYGGRGVKNKA